MGPPDGEPTWAQEASTTHASIHHHCRMLFMTKTKWAKRVPPMPSKPPNLPILPARNRSPRRCQCPTRQPPRRRENRWGAPLRSSSHCCIQHGLETHAHLAQPGWLWIPKLPRTLPFRDEDACKPQDLETVRAPSCPPPCRQGKIPPNAIRWRTRLPQPSWPDWPPPMIRQSANPQEETTNAANGLHGEEWDRWEGYAPRPKSTT